MQMQPLGQAAPLGLPYFRLGHPGSHDFIDLKRELNRVVELPEARAEPELEALLRQLNASASAFKSTGCERWYDEVEKPEGKVNYGSYVGFALDAWPFSEQQAAFATIQRWQQYNEALPLLESVYGRFEFLQTSWNQEARVGWSLDFWTWGFGETRSSARDRWVLGIRRFGAFMADENTTWLRFLAENPNSP